MRGLWMHRTRLQRAVGRSRLLRGASIGLLARLELLLLSGHKDPSTVRLIRRTRRERESLLTGNEAFLLYSLAAALSALEGDLAEVGVYRGASAKLLCEAKGARTLHLFDTFTGLPELGPGEGAVLRRNQFAVSLDEVASYLAAYPGVELHPGVFPASAGAVAGRRFSLVHLDVDLRESTAASLEFFYPRLVPGGALVVHDYSILAAVRAAVDGFFDGRPEPVVELPTTQAVVWRR